MGGGGVGVQDTWVGSGWESSSSGRRREGRRVGALAIQGDGVLV